MLVHIFILIHRVHHISSTNPIIACAFLPIVTNDLLHQSIFNVGFLLSSLHTNYPNEEVINQGLTVAIAPSVPYKQWGMSKVTMTISFTAQL